MNTRATMVRLFAILLLCPFSSSAYGWVHRSEDGGQTWTRIRAGLELRDWYLVAGQWTVENNILYQNALNDCNVAFTARPVEVQDATFTVRTRITQVADGDILHWSGLSVGLPALTSPWSAGVLAGMRANGEVFLWSDGVTRISAVGAVGNTTQWQTLGIRVSGNSYTLLLNQSVLGTWTDSGNDYGSGYFTLATCKARGQFDDVTVTGGATFSDDFNIGNWKQGHRVQHIEWSRLEPGVAYANTSNAVFRTEDHGLTWTRMTGSADEDLFHYAMHVSRFGSGNVYVTQGSFYPPSFVTGVFVNGTGPLVPLGSPATEYYRSPLAEDALDQNVLYTSQFGVGPEIFTGPIPGALEVPRQYWQVR